jgi:hypothetical protein
MTSNGVDLARQADLNYVSDDAPGYCRIRRGRGFSYLGPNNEPAELGFGNESGRW